ncbi:MAG: xanthine dehydrogenase family protein [Chloroflexi bacterium]|nr:xanthine dehydrogenase family protein [Chloroflexota bacterium]
MATPTASDKWVGQPIPVFEDRRFVTGRGTYVDDITLPRTLHAAYVRSPHAHARIVSIDATAALAAAGVVGVFTAADFEGVVAPMTTDPGTKGLKPMTSHPLAVGKARFVGDPVAVVVARDRYTAEDAADLVEVEYEPLPAAVDTYAALEPGAPIVDESLGDNVIFRGELESGDLAGAFAAADRIVKLKLSQHRQTQSPIETRGYLASWDPASERLLFYSSTRRPHLVRTWVATLLGLPENKVRVIAPDVGGAFGQKFPLYREEIGVAALALKLGQPVKWIEDRRENLVASQHAREEFVELEAAVKNDGEILGVKARIIYDMGSYTMHTVARNGPPMAAGRMVPGGYKYQNYRYEALAVASNKAPQGAYRGPWGPISTWAAEGLADAIARELKLDPANVRRRNIIRKEDLPFKTASGNTYQAVSLDESLEKALSAAGYEEFRRQQAELRQQGRYLGLGISVCIEPTASGTARAGTPWAGYDSATVRIEPNGQVTAAVGLHSHGQAHETTFAQVIADVLGVTPTEVTLLHGDTASTPYGMGTGGSRSGIVGMGSCTLAAQQVKDKLLRLAGHVLEAAPEDLELAGGKVSIRGIPDKSIPLARLANLAYFKPFELPKGMEPGLEATSRYEPPAATFANATHICVVEVDAETGMVTIQRYVIAEDVGNVINPLVVDSQVHGGIANAIGGVLLEHIVYDEQGQMLSATYADYLLPTMTEVPRFQIEHIVTPSIGTIGGLKGVGEGGTIAAPAAICNAVSDALEPFGVFVTEQPLSPARVLSLIQAARGSGTR